MYKLEITLGYTFFEPFISTYNEAFGLVLPKISQHKIVLSNKIISYYREKAIEHNLVMMFDTFIQYITGMNSRCVLEKDRGNSDIVEELEEIASGTEMKLLLAEKTEIKKCKKARLYDLKKITDDWRCPLNLYSLPVVACYVHPGTDSTFYKNWMKNWFKGEKNLTIRDQYFFTNDSFASFTNNWLPMIEKGSNIEIHVKDDLGVMSQLNDPKYSDYNFFVYKFPKIHERVIIFDDFQIVIGKGISFVGWDWDKTAETFISISEKTIDYSDQTRQRVR